MPFGVIGEGETVQETKMDFMSGVEDMRDYYKQEGKTFPEGVEFEFKYDLPSFLQYYAYAFTLAGQSKAVEPLYQWRAKTESGDGAQNRTEDSRFCRGNRCR